MTYLPARAFRIALVAATASVAAAPASAQERSPGFLDNIFGGGQTAQPPARTAQANTADLAVRLERLENHIRQLTGAIEQLQFRNQQLEQQIQRMQGDPGVGAAAAASRPAAPPARATVSTPPMLPPPAAPVTAPPAPGRRSDVFDPAQDPSAPGAPRTLGSIPVIAAPEPGASGARAAGAPLDLSTPSGVPAADPSQPLAEGPDSGMLPPPPPRNPNATGAQLAAVAPPSQTPKDEFDLAYGYIKHKEFAAAEEGLRGFLRKYPSDRLTSDAQYWLGESLYQRQRYRDAAESFLTVTTKYENSAKAPEALLRLGQSLAALGEKETACAAWSEISRKYSRAPAAVKNSVAAEQKRVRC